MRKYTIEIASVTYRWKDSVKLLTATHALTNRSKVIPGGGPYPVEGPVATRIGSEPQAHLPEGVIEAHHISVQSASKCSVQGYIRSCAGLLRVHIRLWFPSDPCRNA